MLPKFTTVPYANQYWLLQLYYCTISSRELYNSIMLSTKEVIFILHCPMHRDSQAASIRDAESLRPWGSARQLPTQGSPPEERGNQRTNAGYARWETKSQRDNKKIHEIRVSLSGHVVYMIYGQDNLFIMLRSPKFGSLAVYITTAKLKSAKISYSHMILWWSRTEHPNLCPILGSTAKFNYRQYFQLYGMPFVLLSWK